MHSAKKCERGDPSGFITVHSVVKYQKTRTGDPLETKKIRKSRTVPKKIRRARDPLGTSGFVCFLEKVKNERGTLWGKFASLPGPDLAIVGFRIVSKKWTDQCEDCSLKKQDGNV